MVTKMLTLITVRISPMTVTMDLLEQELTPLQRLIFAYAGAKDRRLYAAIFALDNRCAAILRATNEVMLGQMRLAWWRDVMAKPAEERPKGDPVLAALASLETEGLDLANLVSVVNAWELLLVSEELTIDQAREYAEQRSFVFTAIAANIDTDMDKDAIEKSGRFWALWDFARHASDDVMRSTLMEELSDQRHAILAFRLPKALRPLSILLRLAANDAKKGDVDSPLMRPAVAATIIWHGVTGL